MNRTISKVVREIADVLKNGPIREIEGQEWREVHRTQLNRWILALAPKERTRRPRDPIRAARKTTVKELDALARAVVFARDEGKCQWGSGHAGTDWAHVRSRRFRSTRWMSENAVVLCRGCHLKWHQNPLLAADWFKDKFPNRTNVIRQAMDRTKTDLNLVRLHLEQEARKLGISLTKEEQCRSTK